ncbi:hypothetical protein, partial [Escherichia coli]|uniref:hypothetical protein n=1 Tax=Escherichia coli TaxID=562 RepID=UPI001BEA6FF0
MPTQADGRQPFLNRAPAIVRFMKAVIFACIVLLGIDLVAYGGGHMRSLGANLQGAGHEVGSWVYQ